MHCWLPCHAPVRCRLPSGALPLLLLALSHPSVVASPRCRYRAPPGGLSQCSVGPCRQSYRAATTAHQEVGPPVTSHWGGWVPRRRPCGLLHWRPGRPNPHATLEAGASHPARGRARAFGPAGRSAGGSSPRAPPSLPRHIHRPGKPGPRTPPALGGRLAPNVEREREERTMEWSGRR